MRKLLRANLFRLRRDKIFWLTLLVLSVIVSGVLNYAYSMSHPSGAYRVSECFEENYFSILPFSGLILCAPVSFYLGVEFSDGGIRRKLMAGHTKARVYLANLLTALILTLSLCCIWLAGAVVGAQICGLELLTKAQFIRYLAVSVCSLFPIAAILTLAGHLMDNKALTALISVALVLLLILSSAGIDNTMSEPERVSYYEVSVNSEPEFRENVENPNYIRNPVVRSILSFLDGTLAVSQQIHIANVDEFSIFTKTDAGFMITASLAQTILISGVGILLFRRRDLK